MTRRLVTTSSTYDMLGIMLNTLYQIHFQPQELSNLMIYHCELI